MSPEILAGTIGCEWNAWLKADVYSLGILFWEILSRYPFSEGSIVYACFRVRYDLILGDGSSQNYEMPFERQLVERKLEVVNPSVEDMIKVIQLQSPLNRPLVDPIWSDRFGEIVRTMEQCWDQNPDGRLMAALVAQRMEILLEAN